MAFGCAGGQVTLAQLIVIRREQRRAASQFRGAPDTILTFERDSYRILLLSHRQCLALARHLPSILGHGLGEQVREAPASVTLGNVYLT